MERHDIQGVERAPASINKYLLLKGGKNIYDEPNFRLIWASTRLRYRGGRHQDWDKNLSAKDRGGVVKLESGLLVPSHYKPDRVFVGVRLVKKYSGLEGWILERWIPAVFYGTAADWNDRVVPGTAIPFGGPYPAHGDFEMCHHSAALEVPSISSLQDAMDRSQRTRENHRADVGQVVLERVNEDEWQYHEQIRKEGLEREQMMQDILKPLHATSLGMGRHRTKMAESIGIYTHVGN